MTKTIILSLFVLLTITVSSCSQPKISPFSYRIAVVGHPVNPYDTRYDDRQLNALKELGFNTLQLNIAWGARPADEPLNLEDILPLSGEQPTARIAERLETIRFRAKQAKSYGFRTLFHFGAPRVDSLYQSLRPDLIDATTEKYSILKPEIVQKYVDFLKRLKQEIPELDDIQLYTFDQEAWIGNEFGDGPTDRDIPLHERITPFLNTLTQTWGEVSPNGILWWEPWEMSAGQIYACIPALPSQNFGLFLHSNIAEVQLTRPIDVWFKNMVVLLNERKIPVVGEIFMSCANEEVEPLQHIAAPRLVFEELAAMQQIENLAGVKEYFGLIPDQYDPNLILAGIKLNDPNITFDKAIDQLIRPYGKAQNEIRKAWEYSAQGLALFPWDATWRFRRLPINPADIEVFHKWDIAHLMGSVAPSPSWKSTRRSLFMVTENEPLDPWFFEDIELRCQSSALKLQTALEAFAKVEKAMAGKELYASYIQNNIQDLNRLEQIVTAIRCYYREANLCWLMRRHLAQEREIPKALIKRFNEIMNEDIRNQEKGWTENTQGRPSAAEMLDRFNADPATWVRQYLLFQ